MKIVYAGSPQYAVAPLKALIDAGCEVVAVLTQPDKPTGRKRVLTPTPVKEFALSHGIPVCDFVKVREHVEELKSFGADLMITCAYGQLLTDDILNAFPLGVYNLHASLLPLYRGASPIQSAILAGEEYTGVTVMKTELALDCGGILLVKRCKVGGRTCGELSEELSELSATAAVEAVEILKEGEPQLLLQDEARATYCKKISKADAAVDFKEPAQKIANLINAMSPSPAAFAYLNGAAVNLLKAAPCEGSGECGAVLSADKRGVVIACGEGAVCVSLLQFAGGKAIAAADAVNGRKIKAGDKFD
ncbi:MAG: methionyl-tRNA formyltransferase [Clostridia bacterium]|nr:methionyl-tRNA formyltransferase [Clostridia bacterium]